MGSEHTVYLRTTGFGEKESFYELYDQIPEFDTCGVANISPISQTHIDSTLGKPIQLEINNNSMKLFYATGPVSVEVLKNIAITIE